MEKLVFYEDGIEISAITMAETLSAEPVSGFMAHSFCTEYNPNLKISDFRIYDRILNAKSMICFTVFDTTVFQYLIYNYLQMYLLLFLFDMVVMTRTIQRQYVTIVFYTISITVYVLGHLLINYRYTL